MRSALILACILALLFLATPEASAGTVHDLRADWSDTSNPNGPWSLLKAPDSLFTTNQADLAPTTSNVFGSPQPGWSDGLYPSQELTPCWLKRTSDYSLFDMPDGTIGVWIYGGWTAAVWTSPITGTVDIDLSIWVGQVVLGRTSWWSIQHNESEVASGREGYIVHSTSAAPDSLLIED